LPLKALFKTGLFYFVGLWKKSAGFIIFIRKLGYFLMEKGG